MDVKTAFKFKFFQYWVLDEMVRSNEKVFFFFLWILFFGESENSYEKVWSIIFEY